MKIKLHVTALCFIYLTNAVELKAQEVETTEVEQFEQRTQMLESAIKTLQKFKVSGYIQTQYQVAQENAELSTNMKVGGPNENIDTSYSRFGIRRGRIKFTYEEGIASGVFQLDITESGVGVKDAYLNIKDPWFQTSNLRSGIFERTFGYEISYSSSRRESPERSTIFQTLFPNERDLGTAIYLQPAKTSPLNFLHLDIGIFAGNGIKSEMDNRLDFIGRLYATNNIGSHAKYGIGASYYNGGMMQLSKSVYTMDGDAFVLDKDSAGNFRKYAKREYFGIDGQFNIIAKAGMTKIHAEYLFGQQPGLKASSKSPNTGVLGTVIREMNPDLVINDTYIRNFSGGYIMFTQDLGKLPFTAVLKYDWYDPNTKVKGSETGKEVGQDQYKTGFADLTQNTLGFGALWRVNNNFRLTAYYEINNYEKSDLLYAFNPKTNGEKTYVVDNLKRNVFTLRLQYKF
ncbi:MAG: hypothetical protein LBG96_11880 [Tannerella sp.]|jgi:hypothetical protein|nr:hypothetical protein [Tannerella sp.]